MRYAIRGLVGVVTTFAGSLISGLSDGSGSNAEFIRPGGMFITPLGDIFVSDDTRVRLVTTAGELIH